MTHGASQRTRRAIVWLCRILAGATFIISGWAKCVDPYGFVYKIQEYLGAWNLTGVFPADIILVGSAGLSLFELIVGVMLLTGCMKRFAPLAGLAMMAVMLPLTVYLYIASPVSDCGCFGDLIVLSDGATLLKNIILTALLVMALLWGGAASPLYRPGLQWLVIVLTAAYGLLTAIIGWNIQPVVDFRPYAPGRTLISQVEESMPEYIYEKDGEQRVFTLDSLPDDSWTFVRQQSAAAEGDGGLAVFDGDEEVTADALECAGSELFILTVLDPGADYLTRARLANEFSETLAGRGARLVALVAASGEALDIWKDLARPRYEVYSVSDTSLKQLARGKSALVAVDDCRVAWKINFAALDPAMVRRPDLISALKPVDNGDIAVKMAGAYLFAMLLLAVIDRSLRRRRKPAPALDEADI